MEVGGGGGDDDCGKTLAVARHGECGNFCLCPRNDEITSGPPAWI